MNRRPVLLISLLGVLVLGFAIWAFLRWFIVTDGNVVKQCSNLAIEIALEKSPTGNVSVTGTVKNTGPGDYYNEASPLDAYFFVQTTYPPAGWAGASGSEVGHQNTGVGLEAGESRTFTTDYQIPNFVRWGNDQAPGPGERWVAKEFTARVEPTNSPGFSQCEDSVSEDGTTYSVVVLYTEKME